MLLGRSRPQGWGLAQFLPIATALIVASTAVGCGSGEGAKAGSAKPVLGDPSLREEGRALFGGGRGQPSEGAGAVQPDAARAWTIVLAGFRGDGREVEAARVVQEARTRHGLPQAFVETRGPNTVVAYGAFEDPTAPAAQAEVERIRGIRVGDTLPYGGAFLAPPFEIELGSRPEHNLLTAKQTYGEDALYTLQVAAYGPANLLDRPTEKELAEARAAAEEAAAVLRREGELAFYYHGPTRSMVTIGVFDETDFDPQTPGYQSRRLMDARKRFPQNLYNGAAIRVKQPGRSAHLQESKLVNLPGN